MRRIEHLLELFYLFLFPFLLDSNLEFIIITWKELICAYYRKRLTHFELIILFSQI